MKKNWLLPGLAVAAGAVGFGLRKWQLATGFEPDTGLAVPGAPAAAALLIFSALVCVALIALCWRIRGPVELEEAFDARENPVFLTAVVLSAFLMLLGAVLDVLSYPALRQSLAGSSLFLPTVLPLLRIVLGFLTCPAVLLWARQLYRSCAEARESLALLVPFLTTCIWLISDYQTRAADPVTMDFLYEVLAIVSAVMAFYYLAGYSFQQGRPRRTLVVCLMAAYFALVTLADRHTLADLARFGFVALFAAAHAALLLTPAPARPISTEEKDPEREDDPDE